MILACKEFPIFLIVVLAGYHLLRARRWKYLWLTLASWTFYAWASPGYLWVILLLTAIDYFAALRIEASADERVRRRWLILSIVSNLGLLGAFKYAAFVFDNALTVAGWTGFAAGDRTWEILLPLGISFHTFQGISYTVDVHRRRIPAVRNFVDYALFVSFFPQLAAGPIVRAVEFLPQMVVPPKVGWAEIELGLRLVVVGILKKFFIADQLHDLFVAPVFLDPGAYPPDIHRWATVAWAIQIYCDFSGYTDMALGLAKWFGFDLPPNFHLPYLATNIGDFWRRWHISLSSWLRDYLYFPLGGSRGSAARTYLNLMLLFVLCGLWHGAAWHWLAYGAYNGLLMGLHRAFDRTFPNAAWRKRPAWIAFAWAATAYQLLFGLVLIRMNNWETGLQLQASLLGIGTGGGTALTRVPLPVIVLMLAGLAGHIGAARPGISIWLRRPGRMQNITLGAGYAASVALLVAFGPGVTKSFLYIAF